MIFRRKCVCAVMFTISILIVTGCGESYDDGYDDGLRNGRLEGYDVGYKAGHELGYGEGHDHGHKAGYNEGRDDGHKVGYGEGRDDGHKAGYDEGHDAGHELGYGEGHDRGHELGYDEGSEAVKPPIINQITVNPLPSSDPTVTIQDLFIYENIKMTERSKGRSLEFSGEITNRTGIEFSFAKFEITLYDANRRSLDTNTVFIHSFKANAKRSFDKWIFVPIEDVKHYSIMFVD